ncbi:DUF4097 family beta strand repeat-containing protein [Effusibacillus lacus]|uniref:DUF4097 domain-containing protein n=1 Tax=Effusibacillus lacus TaxID=1348429 RepID=A0A292YQK1_9BACL|nr:DUF4097 family beta strand repeat-containing protein [Effusibacillus lacus]TCS68766.1 DUF4097 and DUF4098 domain-containing protein YvlB [Effusibacillus lacus]GAX90684.1 hypothetical protein EFBL_2322 [Effusibacillus lacus]
MPKKVGIIPLAITLIVLGLSIILTKVTGVDWFGKALNFWPLVLIAIGAEILWRQSRSRNGEGPAWKLDGKSIFLLILVLAISGVVHGVNSVATSYHKDGIRGIISAFEGFGPGQLVTLQDQDLALAGAESLLIENPVGKIRVEGTDGDKVHLRADANVHLLDRTAAEERAKQIEIRVQDGKNAKIIVEDRAGIQRMNPPSVRLTLQVPKRMAIITKGKMGEVEVAGVASVNAESDTGRVAVEKIQNLAKIRTNMGEIKATEVGSADLESDMGRVDLREVKGNVKARTDKGEVKVQTSTPVAGDWELKTDMGRISVTFPANSSVRFEGKTDKGSISGLSGPEGRVNGPGPRATQTFGEGKYRIYAETNLGSIEVQN